MSSLTERFDKLKVSPPCPFQFKKRAVRSCQQQFRCTAPVLCCSTSVLLKQGKSPSGQRFDWKRADDLLLSFEAIAILTKRFSFVACNIYCDIYVCSLPNSEIFNPSIPTLGMFILPVSVDCELSGLPQLRHTHSHQPLFSKKDRTTDHKQKE